MSDLATLLIEPILGRDYTRRGIAILADTGVPQVLTGWQFELILRRWHNDAKSIPVSIAITSALNGEIAIPIPGDDLVFAGCAPLERWSGIVRSRPTLSGLWQDQFRVAAIIRSAHE